MIFLVVMHKIFETWVLRIASVKNIRLNVGQYAVRIELLSTCLFFDEFLIL